MKKALIIHHTDLDGAGVKFIGEKIARKKGYFPVSFSCSYGNVNQTVRKQVEYHLRNLALIIIGDISVDRNTAEWLNKISKHYNIEIILRDHHKTAEWLNVYKWAEVHEEINGNLRCGTYQLAKVSPSIFKQYEFFIRTINDWDTWTWVKKNNEVARKLNSLHAILGEDEFCSYMVSKKEIKKEEDLFDRECEIMIKMRDKLIRRQVDKLIKDMWITQLKYKGKTYNCGICLVNDSVSEISHYILQKKDEIDILILITSPKTLSLRTKKDLPVKLGDLAKELASRGGGHPQSAGATFDDMQTYRILNYILNSNSKLEFSNLDHNKFFINK